VEISAEKWAQNKNRNVEKSNILRRLFTHKTKKTEQDGRPTVATSVTQNTPLLSTVFEILQVFVI
jgi:hypothetical protein